MHVDWSFESGSLEIAEVCSPDLVRVVPYRDYNHEGRNWTSIWCYFALNGAKGRRVRLQFLDLIDEWNYKASFSWGNNTRPVVSADQVAWQHITDVVYDARRRTLTASVAVDADPLYVAYQPPYGLSQLQRFLASIVRRPGVTVTSLGVSAGGRPIPLVELGANTSGDPHVWVVSRQHPWETASTYAAEGLLNFLTSNTPEAVAILERVAFHVVPIANPDGVALGNTRYNLHGYDLNRDYDKASLQTCPETYHLLERLRSDADSGHLADLLINIHNNNQECGDLVAGSSPESVNVERFATVLARHTFFRGSVTTCKKSPLPHANSTYILVEMRTGYEPTLGRYVAVDDQLQYGAGLARAIGNYYGVSNATSHLVRNDDNAAR